MKTNNIKLSIIVPVYNVEKYVERCLKSILSQDFPETEYEVIIQNDGSTDNSLEVVKKVVEEHENCLVLCSQNRGLSAARNAALCHALGEYIWFIDSDDWIEPDAINKLLPYMNEKYDVIQFGWNNVFSDGKKEENHRMAGEMTGCQCLLFGDWPMGAQFSIFNREWGTHLDAQFRFVEGIYHEDNEFTPRIIHQAQRVRVIDELLYNYFKGNQNSTLTKPNIKKCYDLMTVSKMQVDYASSIQDKAVRTKFIDLAASAFNTGLGHLPLYTIDQRKKFIDKQEKLGLVWTQAFLHSSHLKYKMMALCIFLFSLRFYVKLLSFRTK